MRPRAAKCESCLHTVDSTSALAENTVVLGGFKKLDLTVQKTTTTANLVKVILLYKSKQHLCSTMQCLAVTNPQQKAMVYIVGIEGRGDSEGVL